MDSDNACKAYEVLRGPFNKRGPWSSMTKGEFNLNPGLKNSEKRVSCSDSFQERLSILPFFIGLCFCESYEAPWIQL